MMRPDPYIIGNVEGDRQALRATRRAARVAVIRADLAAGKITAAEAEYELAMVDHGHGGRHRG